MATPRTDDRPRTRESLRDDLVRMGVEPATTPTSMGAIPETFRTWPGTLRSDHPLESVCARGRFASGITGNHPLAFSEGPGGPFGRLHEHDCRILLIGVGFNRCTALHYAESLVEKRRTTTVRFPALDGGRRALLFPMDDLVDLAVAYFEEVLEGDSGHGGGGSRGEP